MSACPFCGLTVPDIPAHYGGDSCPALVRALGAVTPAGKRQEKLETLGFQYQTTERDRLANAEERKRGMHVRQTNAYHNRTRRV